MYTSVVVVKVVYWHNYISTPPFPTTQNINLLQLKISGGRGGRLLSIILLLLVVLIIGHNRNKTRPRKDISDTGP
jgi:hypothetical protein